MKALLHAHSNYSHDGKRSLSELAGFCEKEQIKYILLTEHAEDFDEAKMRKYVEECEKESNGKVTLLPGLEFGFKEYPSLHLLGIGIREFIAPTDIASMTDQIQSQGGLAVIAHPSRNDHFVPEEVIGKIDGIEIWNAAYDSRYFPHHMSLKLYGELRKTNKSLIAFSGLDMHDTKGFRELVLSISGVPDNGKELLALLKSGSFINSGKMLSLPSDREAGFLAFNMIRASRIILNVADQVYWAFKGNGK